MPIRSVVSTLPDPRYVAALEAELEAMKALLQRIASATGVK